MAALLAGPIMLPTGSQASADSSAPAAATTTNPNVFASKFSAQALTPTTNATLQVDDSVAWVHGFFSKSQPGQAVNAAEYAEVFDPGFLAGAVLFSSSTDPTPLEDPNNFPGYAWASYPVPAGQTNITKCVSPTAMVAAPCAPGSPDQAISIIDPSVPSGSSYVTATGPGPGDTGGVFTASSTQGLKGGNLVVTSEAAGENVSFAGGQLVLSGFRSVATSEANAAGKVSGSASCVMGDIDVMGTSVVVGPNGQINTSQLDVLLAQLDQATGKKFEVLPPTKPVIAPGDHSFESSCQGPTVVINNPLPGPLGSLNVSQVFALGVVDVAAGASNSAVPATGSGGPAVATPAGPAGPVSTGLTGLTPATGAVNPTSEGLTNAQPTYSPPTGTPASSAPVASPAPSSTQEPGNLLAGAPRTVSTHVNDPLVFSLTLVSGLLIIGTSVGFRRTASRLVAGRRELFGFLG